MSPAETAGGREAPLEDLMVAMDVVDTIRHRRLIVERELDAAGRRQRLIERLRDIYTAQGIEVSDAALEAGVDALEKERFAYAPASPGVGTFFARLYVRRDRWLKAVLGIIAVALLVWLAWYVTITLPQQRVEAAMPARIEAAYDRVTAIADTEAGMARANELRSAAERAVEAGDFGAAGQRVADLEALERELRLAYEIRIVSRPNEMSGVWRVPDVNPDARNFYLVVEAVDGNGNVIEREVRNEEDGRTYRVRKWGLRVDEATFEAVAADKRADGIVDDYVVGSKTAGRLEPNYRVPTSGATITEW